MFHIAVRSATPLLSSGVDCDPYRLPERRRLRLSGRLRAASSGDGAKWAALLKRHRRPHDHDENSPRTTIIQRISMDPNAVAGE